MPTLLPNAEQTFFDNNGNPLSSGFVYFYVPGTTSPKATYQDPQQTILNQNPVVLDAGGRAIIWGSGTYRQQVFDVNGNLIWDQVTEDTSGGLLGNITDNTFTASGGGFVPSTTTQLTISSSPISAANVWVYFDAAYQTPDTWSVSNTTITFNAPIPVGVQEVNIKVGSTIAIGTPGSGTVTDSSVANNAAIKSSKLSYIQGGSGSVLRTVQSRLQDIVSIADYGAVPSASSGNGVLIQNAINSAIANGNALWVPAGTWVIDTPLVANGPVCIFAEAGATFQGVSTLTSPILTVENVNQGISAPYARTEISGLQFDVRGNYSGLVLSNTAFLNATFEEGAIIENCHFTSYGYTTVGSAYLMSLQLVENVRVSGCAFNSYSANGQNGINNGLSVLGSANCVISGCNFLYLNNAIGLANQGTQITQGIQFVGCIGNGNQNGVITSNTNDVQFSSCLFDNHSNQAVNSLNDLGIAFSDCYLGGSVTNNLVQVSITSASANQNCHFSNCVFICYTANTMNSLLSIQGVSGTFYNNAVISACEFRDLNNVGAAVTANYVSGSAMTGCTLTGVTASSPVSITNSPVGTTGLRCVNNIGVNPWGPITGTGGYPSPTPLTTVGSNNFYQNPYPFDCMVYVAGGTISGVQVSLAARAINFGIVQTVLVPEGAQILVGFTGSPTWEWCGI